MNPTNPTKKMEQENENNSDNLGESREKDEIEDFEELAPLRALSVALIQRIRVSTSRIKVNNEKAAASTEFVGVEGVKDANTLQYLKTSLSDIIPWEEDGQKIASPVQFASISEHEIASTIPDDLAKVKVEERSSNAGGSSFFSIPSCTSSFDGVDDPESLQKAEEAIVDLEKNGPAGLVHLSSLSAAVGKPIRVWSSGNAESKKVGRTRTGEAVDVEYHEPGPDESQGHWTLPGNREPRDVAGQLNDCLFNVVADQTNNLAPELRAATISRMRKNVKSLANRIDKIAKLEECDRISLLVGGARYVGRRPQDAAEVIDKSQQGRCHPDNRQGHPRGHASHPQATGLTESAENYSHTGMKSAFLSREDQDAVGHLALATEKARQAMNNLNAGSTSIAIRVQPGELEPGPLPTGVEFLQGERRGGERPIRELVLVLRHHVGQSKNAEADVFVHTFYPVLM